jgi:hypothetical protein
MLDSQLDEISRSPSDDGVLELIVGRPAEGEREVLEVATIDEVEGLVGDTWRQRGSSRTPDGSADPGKKITVMNARAALAVAGSPERRALAGDQLFVDLDLSQDNLPAGSRLLIGSVVLEISAEPHNGCAKFSRRFGLDAIRFVNSPVGKQMRLRGLNAAVVVGGEVRVGDVVRKAAVRTTA